MAAAAIKLLHEQLLSSDRRAPYLLLYYYYALQFGVQKKEQAGRNPERMPLIAAREVVFAYLQQVKRKKNRPKFRSIKTWANSKLTKAEKPRYSAIVQTQTQT